MKKLTGAGNPFHSALDKAAGMLKRKVGTGAEFMQELNSIPGVKKEEILDRKLHDIMGMPKMTHEQFLGELGKRPAPQIEEKVLGQKLTPQELARETNQFIRDRARQYAGEYAGTSREYRILAGDEMRRLRGEHLPSIREHVERQVAKQDAPHHEKDYTLPGGENYREMLIKAPPGEEQFPGVIAHFGGEPGILASMRLKDRTGPNGEKLLHLEELQSDWHQQGRDRGYGADWQVSQDENGKFIVLRNGRKVGGDGFDNESMAQRALEVGQRNDKVVPDAPFKKNWEEMALKRLIHHAAEKGYHGIVVTPGEEQADRYDLSKQIDGIEYSKNSNGTVDFAATKNNSTVFDKTMQTPEQIEGMVGKEIASKIFNSPDNSGSLTGVDLKVGGEGMKGFYDKKVPNILNSIGKKYGVKTELHGHKTQVGEDFSRNANGDISVMKIPKYAQLHHFPITEEMRQDVLKNGLPLYKEGGDVHMADGGEVESSPAAAPKNQGVPMNPTIAQMKMALAKGNPLNVQNIGADEAPSMSPKTYLPPDTQTGKFVPPGGAATPSGLAVGGIDMNSMQPGNQLMPGGLQAMQPPPQQPQQGPQQAPQGQQAPQAGGNILQMTPQGRAMAAIGPQQAPGMAGGGQPKKPLHYPPSPSLSKAQIEAHAERMARQVSGLENPNEKTLKQLAREQDLPVGIRKAAKKQDVPVIDWAEKKGSYSVGVPGDPSRGGLVPASRSSKRMGMAYPKAGEYLKSVGGEKLESPVPLYGGKDYGAYGHPEGWASDLGASAGMFNIVKRLAEEDPTKQIYGHYHKMSPESLYHAVHMMDAVLSHHRPHEQSPEMISNLNRLMRDVAITTNKDDRAYPEFPGFENPSDVMFHGSLNSGMRKKIIKMLGTEKYFPGGKQKLEDLIYAVSHPELRNIETGAGGSSILQFDPSRELRQQVSKHPTYGHDIPSKLVGRNRYITPAEIIAPRSMHNAVQEIKAMGKKVVPFNQAKMNIIREPIDEQFINQIGEYEHAMKKRLGYKKGGKVSQDTMRLELTKQKKGK